MKFEFTDEIGGRPTLGKSRNTSTTFASPDISIFAELIVWVETEFVLLGCLMRVPVTVTFSTLLAAGAVS